VGFLHLSMLARVRLSHLSVALPALAALTNNLDNAVVHAGDMSNVDKTTFVWMVNIVETLEKLGAPLQHVYFTQGWVLAQPLEQCSCNSVVQLWYLLMPFCILFL